MKAASTGSGHAAFLFDYGVTTFLKRVGARFALLWFRWGDLRHLLVLLGC